MTRRLFALFLLAPLLAFAATRTIRAQFYKGDFLLTAAAPTAITDGIALGDVRGVRVTLCAATGQTLTGSGTLDSYVLPPGSTASTDWAPGATPLTVPVAASGKHCWSWPEIEVLVPAGRGAWIPNGIGVSGGTTVQEYVDQGLTR